MLRTDPEGRSVPVAVAAHHPSLPGWEIRWGEVAGVRIRYALAGAAGRPPLVLLHGIGRSLEDWAAAAGLGADFRVYALDMMGFGLSAKPGGRYTLARLADFVLAFAERHAGRRPVALVGNSLGSAVAMEAAARRPERVRALALVASAGFGRHVTWGLRLATLPHVGELMLRPTPTLARRTERLLYADPSFATPDRIARTLDLARQPGATRAYLATLRFLGDARGVKWGWRRDLHARLAGAPPPMLLAWGDADRVLPATHLDRAANLYPHAHVARFPDVGHLPQIEAAAAFHTAVRDFLEAHA